MITIFNRKEVCITQSLNERMRVRDILASANIDYSIKTKSLNGGGRMGRTSAFMKTDYMYEYRIYVNKKDYEEAYYQIHKKYVC